MNAVSCKVQTTVLVCDEMKYKETMLIQLSLIYVIGPLFERIVDVRSGTVRASAT